MKTTIFAFTLICCSTLSWIAFSSTKADVKIILKAAQANNIIVTGNSIVDYVAPCDRARETIPQMTESLASKPITDLSKGGQSFWEAIQFVRLTQAINPGIETAVFAFTPAAFAVSTLKTQSSLSKNFALSMISTPSLSRLFYATFATPPENIDNIPLSHKGRHFGRYNDIKKVFQKEDARAGCPEGPAEDSLFYQFMHWRALQKLDSNDFDFNLIINSLKEIKSKGTEPLVILLPLPMDDFRRITGSDTTRIDFVINRIKDAARSKDITIIDLSRVAPSDYFAQKWCACGHLNEFGRKMVSEEIAKALIKMR